MKETGQIHDDLWPYILTLLPSDLEITARKTGALFRARGVKNAEYLLRMILAYGVSNQSLKGVVAWAKSIGIADMSATAFYYKLRESSEWLSYLISEAMSQVIRLPKNTHRYRLKIVDATCIKSPGQFAPYWRIHTEMDPIAAKLTNIHITDQYKGDNLLVHSYDKNDLVLGDRAYTKAKTIAELFHQEVNVLLRVNPHQIRFCSQDKQLINLYALEKEVPLTGGIEFELLMPEPPLKKRTKSHKTWNLQKAVSWIPVRIIGGRTKKGNVIWLLTTMQTEDLSADNALDLYRFRWQIELLFKRLKSILNLDELPAKTEPLVKTWLLARLLAAILIERLLYDEEIFSPWGYQV
jgi:hypothetical protein